MGTLVGRLLICSLLIGAGLPIVSAIPIFPGNFTVHFIDVGEGDAIFLVSPANNTTLIDAGPDATMGTKMSEYIQESGLDLDLIIATSSDKDDIGGMQSVLATFTPQAFIDSPYPTTPWTATYQEMLDTINQSGIPYVTVTAGSDVPSFQGVNVSILNPQDVPFPDTNDNSIVLKIQYGSVAFLLMGDATEDAEEAIMQNQSNLLAQILKVGLHGSAASSSPAFLARVEPEVAVIEVGPNQYDHPANATLENLIAAGARIYRTDRNGTVVITTDGSGYTVYTENQSGPSQFITAMAGFGGTIAPNGLVEVDYQATPVFTITPNSMGTGQDMIPPVPQSFYGDVDAAGQPVQVGVPVEVRGVGVMSGVPGNPFIVNETGKYGGGFFDPKLLVQGNILDGTLLTFYVNGHPAQVSFDGGPLQDTYPFTSGTTTPLNLSVPEPVDTPVLIPSYYVIQDVLVDGISKGPATSYQFDPVITNHTISAIFEPRYRNFTILADSGAGGTISPNGTVNVPAGSSPTFEITPDEGMDVLNVAVDNVSFGHVVSFTFINVSANHTIHATFQSENLTINGTAGEGGTISPDGITMVSTGENLTYTITPDANFEILNVTVDNVSVGQVGSYTFTNISENHTIHATFTPQVIHLFSMNGTAGDGGTISPDGMTTVFKGENLTYTIIPDTGFVIQDVTVDNVPVGQVGSYTFSNVSGNHTIFATFTRAEFAIIAEVGPEGMGTITPSGTVDVAAGANQTFTMTPDPDQLNCWGGGTRFVVWNITVDGQVIPGQGEPSLGPVHYTFANVSANHTISVNFSKMFINAKPFAQFDASPRSGFAPLPVHFSQVLVSNHTRVEWSFGDNSTSTEENPDHTYTLPGSYNVSLTIWCNESESFTETQPDFIQVLPSLPPIGGNKGFFLVHSNVDGAQVFFDNDFKGNVTNGTLNVSVYVTATPYRTYTVKKSGYNDFSGKITDYPGKGETVDLYATLTQGGFFNFNFHFVDFPALRFVDFPSFFPF